jgi:mevalonate kinase
MKKVIRLTESDLTRIVKRVIKENEDIDRIDRHLRNIVRGFRTEEPKDFTEIISDISDLIENSKDVNDFKMKIKKYTNDNQEDLKRINFYEINQLDGFINSTITRHDFN